MSRLLLSDDPFASVTGEAGRSRKPLSLIVFMLLPVLALGGIACVPKAHLPAGSLRWGADYDDIPDSCTLKANRIYQIEFAHRKVLYWTHRVNSLGTVTAADRAKVSVWRRAEQCRRAQFARKYGYEAPP